MKIRLFICLVLAAVFIGCDSGEKNTFDVGMTAWGSAALERRKTFAEEMVKAMRDFDDLYGARIKIEIIEVAPGNPTVRVKGVTEEITTGLERPVSVAVTNFSFKYPGIGFIEEDDGSWRIIIPDDMLIPVSGDFKLKFS